MPVFDVIMLKLKFIHRFFHFFEILKKYSLSSEIQLHKVGRIPENSWKSPDPRQHSLSGAHKGVRSHSFTDIESAAVKRHFCALEISELNTS